MESKRLSVGTAWRTLRQFEKKHDSLPVEGQATRLLNVLAGYLLASGDMTAINLSQIARESGLSRITTRNSLDRLSAFGVIKVQVVREGRPVNYAGYSEEFLSIAAETEEGK
ncbi:MULTISPECIES: helix-turn-helix domain-containing protein [Micrococcales]|uniref:hypothetical protein n=1 Tax=Micrococcales TaxID=85006 RepID=UPI0018E0260F|nr:hypothetical protein [Brevibacterium yomogidense]